MHWLCFGGPKDARRAQDDSSLVTETEAVRLMSNVEPERKTRAADLLKLFQGVEYVTPDREALIINIDGITEDKQTSLAGPRSQAAVPSVADGERQQSAVQAVGPPSRGFVRISTTRRRSFTGAPAGSNQANSFLTNASHPPSGTQPPQNQPTSGPGQTQTQTDGDEEGEDTLGPLPESNGLQSSSTTPRQDSTESQGTDATTPSGKRELNWTASKRALAVLVVREEHLSRTDKNIQAQGHNRRLDERLQRLNLDMLTMEGDGNCQFRTLAHELYGSQEHHMVVRSRVMQHIRRNKDEFEAFLGEDFESYVTSMSRSRTWGDELTLRAACDAYGIVIFVVTSDAQNWFLRYEPQVLDGSSGEVFLAYIAPIHYNAIRRRASLRVISKQLSMSFRRLADSGKLSSSWGTTQFNNAAPQS